MVWGEAMWSREEKEGEGGKVRRMEKVGRNRREEDEEGRM
jgi:hypothetical protein